MTTFIRSQGKPSISIDITRKLHNINPNIYGGFIEHMGRCIYGGIYDPGNSLSDEHGFRKDVIQAIQDLKVPVMRYPGGNFTATYHWEDGIGPRGKRPKRPELAWLGTESNQIGTDEFLQWCTIVGCEPYLCLNMATGSLMDALRWVEYCNGTGDTQYANLRRANGHPEPYGVKYWALGNEVWGAWQVMQMEASTYAKMAHQWAKALKLLDPNLVLVLCGETGISNWDHEVLDIALPYIDMLSIHMYTADSRHEKNVTAPLAAEKSIEVASSLIDLAVVENLKRNTIPKHFKKPMICFDEWNVWDPERAPGNQGAEEKYTLSDALAVAVWLNVLIRQSDKVAMANIAQSVNVISPLMTTKDGVRKQATYWPYWLASNFMRGTVLAIHLKCDEWAPENENQHRAGDPGFWARAEFENKSGEEQYATNPVWLRNLQVPTPWLDVAAILDADGVVNLSVVNLSPDKNVEVELRTLGIDMSAETEQYVVTGDGEDVLLDKEAKSISLRGPDEVSITGNSFVFQKHSHTLLRLKTSA